MKKMGKMVALLVLLVLALGLVGAGCGESSDEPGTSDSVATTTPTTAGTTDTTSAVGTTDTTSTTGAATGEVIELTYSHLFPAVHPVHLRLEEWAKAVSDATNGRVKITFHYAQSLLTAAETYEGVVNGIADMGLVVPAYTPGLFPLLELFDLPVDYNNCEVVSKVLWESFQKFQPEEFSKVKVLPAFGIGPGGIATRDPVNTLADLKGKQIRAVGLSASYMKALGAAPVSIAMPEAYEAMSKGVCDGCLNTWDAFVTWKLVEVTDSITMTPFLYTASFFTVVNLDTWNSLPSDIQAAMEKVSEDFIAIHGKGEADNALASIGTIRDLGKQIIVLPDAEEQKWRDAVKPAIDAAIQERQADGLPAQEFYDEMVRLAEQYNASYPSLKDAYLEMGN